MEYKPLTPQYDADLAGLIRSSLKVHRLDIPGTVYFDEGLDHLSGYYDNPGRAYYVLINEDVLIGGIGLAEFNGFDKCCELQKLYLSDEAKGQGLGYKMIKYIEDKARELGYEQMYLETHTNLEAAIHIYEKMGYSLIGRPKCVVHSTMNRFYLKSL